MNQMRENSGKPRVSYIFTNYNSFVKLHTYEIEEDIKLFPLTTDEIFLELSRYLSRADISQDSVIRVLIASLQHLQLHLGGDLPANDPEMSAVQYVLACDKAWDEFCLVCERGAQKYAEGNYRLGESVRHYADSAGRHLLAFARGETLNDDGCCTLAGAVWNLWQLLDQPEWRDDRLQALNDENLSNKPKKAGNT